MPGPADIGFDCSLFHVPVATPESIQAAALKVGACITCVCNAEGFQGAGIRVMARYPLMEAALSRLGHAFQYYGLPSQGLPASHGNLQGPFDAVVPLYQSIGAGVIATLPAVDTRAGQAVAAAIVYILHAHGEDVPTPRPEVAAAAMDFLDMACRLGALGSMPAVAARPFNDQTVADGAGKLERYIAARTGTDGAAERIRLHFPDLEGALTALGRAMRCGGQDAAMIVPDPVFDLHLALCLLAAAPEPGQPGGDIAASAVMRVLDACRAPGPAQDSDEIHDALRAFLGTCPTPAPTSPGADGLP